MDSVRQNKVARLIQKELAVFFQSHSRDLFPGRMITVTIVRVSPDLSLAKAYLSIFPLKPDENVLEQISDQARFIRTVIGRNIRNQVRIIPELAFYLDDSIDYLENIDRLLKS